MRDRFSVILLYTVFGPPIGGLIAFLMAILMIKDPTGAADLSELVADPVKYIAGLVISSFWFAILGYLFGGLQALATGITLSRVATAEVKFTYRAAFIVPLIVGVLAAIPILIIGGWDFSSGHLADFFVPAMMCAIGVAASLCLRFIFRDQFSPKPGV